MKHSNTKQRTQLAIGAGATALLALVVGLAMPASAGEPAQGDGHASIVVGILGGGNGGGFVVDYAYCVSNGVLGDDSCQAGAGDDGDDGSGE